MTLLRVEKPVPLVLRDQEATPKTVQVANFEATANRLEQQRYNFKGESRTSRTLVDPRGNLVGMHDHREGRS